MKATGGPPVSPLLDPEGMGPLRRLPPVLALALLACSDPATTGDDDAGRSPPADASGPAADAQPAGPPPNIVYVVTDDMDLASLRYMPKTRALVGEQGITFENFFLTYAVCCPSRTSVLTGKYPHNHEVLGNSLPIGGFKKFRQTGGESSTVATWLRAGGYTTALVGKYLNVYPGGDPDYVPPGWSEWYGRSAGKGYYDYDLIENGVAVHYGNRAGDYGTDVLARKSVAFIRAREADDDRPFFLYVAPAAPHGPSTPAPRHADLFSDLSYPHGPSFNEADVADKPQWIQQRPPFDKAARLDIDTTYRNRLRSLQAVDDLVESIVAALEDEGELDRTLVIFTSDNGFKLGEHRLRGKRTAYEEDIRAPLLIRGPGVPAGQVRAHWVLNIDLAPTLAELARVESPGVDGRSFRAVLGDGPPAVEDWQRDFLVINRTGDNDDDTPRIDAIRQGRYKYIESADAGRELYDLAADPHELDSIHESADPTLLAGLRARMTELLSCAGDSCR